MINLNITPEQAEKQKHFETIESFYNRLNVLMDELEAYYQDPHANGMYCKAHDVIQELIKQKVELIRTGEITTSVPCEITVSDKQYTITFPDPIQGLGMRQFIHARNRKEGIAANQSRATVRNFVYETVVKSVSDIRKQGVRIEPLYPCVIDFIFRFKHDVIDVDNHLLGMLVNAVKLSGLILADHYKAMRYTVTGVKDTSNPGITTVIRQVEQWTF